MAHGVRGEKLDDVGVLPPKTRSLRNQPVNRECGWGNFKIKTFDNFAFRPGIDPGFLRRNQGPHPENRGVTWIILKSPKATRGCFFLNVNIRGPQTGFQRGLVWGWHKDVRGSLTIFGKARPIAP